MPKLPTLKPKAVVKLLQKLGFLKYRQKGSHLIMIHFKDERQVVIPIHNKPLKKGTLASILRQAQVSIDDLSK